MRKRTIIICGLTVTSSIALLLLASNTMMKQSEPRLQAQQHVIHREYQLLKSEAIVAALEEKQAETMPAFATTGSSAEEADANSEIAKENELYFATKEELMEFIFARFTEEEISIFNTAVAEELTPEQEQNAIRLAYSRFTEEEIAAMERALNQ